MEQDEQTDPEILIDLTGSAMTASIDKLAMALAQVQGSLPAVEKSRRVNIELKESTRTIRYNYADLAAIVEASRELLSKAGLAVVQLPDVRGCKTIKYWDKGQERIAEVPLVAVTTILIHESGQWVRGTLTMQAADAKDPKNVGVVISYARRYALSAMIGIVTEEDNDAQTAPPKSKQKQDDADAPQKSDKYRHIKTGQAKPVEQPKSAPASTNADEMARQKAWDLAKRAFGEAVKSELPKILNGRVLASMSEAEAKQVCKEIEAEVERAALAEVTF